MTKILIYSGAILILTGFCIHLFGERLSWFGNLFGDFKVEKDKFKFYFPFTSMLIISICVTIIINLLLRFFK